LKVAHYEVVGRFFFKSDASREGRSIGCLRSRGRLRAKDRGFDRPYRTELSFTPFPTTSWWATIKCPSGTNSLAPAGRCDLIATFYSDVHGRLPDPPYLLGHGDEDKHPRTRFPDALPVRRFRTKHPVRGATAADSA